jgi:NADH:ubiquinone oxidoreductase subunit 3 (subunit A)
MNELTPNPAEYHPYIFLVVFMAVSVVFGLVPLMLARLWAAKYSPRKPGDVKSDTYECGLESKGDAWFQFKSHYYLYAIIFLVFDVETIFLLPFAVAFGGLSAGAFIAIMIFLLLLVEGLVWAWSKGVLTWK